MTMRMRLVLGLVTLLVCSLIVAGCTSVNANNQKIVTPTTSVNNDQTFIETVQSAGAELNPIIDDLGPAMSAKDYLTVQTLGTKLSSRAQFWHDKIASMPVSAQYQNQKSTYLQSLLDKKATGDEWTTEAQNSGKVTTTSPTVRITYQQTVAIQKTAQGANDNLNFLYAMDDSGTEISQIAYDVSIAEYANEFYIAKTLGTKLSTRSQYWYNKIAPMQVSLKYQESKNAFLLYLSESKFTGDANAEANQLCLNGERAASFDMLNEVNQHATKAVYYQDLATDKLPA